jgi:hypothetical protein
MEVIVLGRCIGNSTGWDEVDYFGIIFYEFESLKPDVIKSGFALYFNSENGDFRVQLDDSEDPEYASYDIIEVLNKFEKSSTIKMSV